MASPEMRLSAGAEVQGKELANQLYHREIVKASTLGQLQTQTSILVHQRMEDPEAAEQLKTIQTSLDNVAEGNENIRLEVLPDNIGGVNYQIGTHDTAMNKNGLDANTLVEDSNRLRGIALHENNEDVGHAGQIDGVQDVIDATGEDVAALNIIEGHVEEGVAEQIGEQRADQPLEVYGEGQYFVQQVGYDTVNDYVHKNGAYAGDRVSFQTEIMKKSPMSTETMVARLADAEYSGEEIITIVNGARGSMAKLGRAPEYAMAT